MNITKEFIKSTKGNLALAIHHTEAKTKKLAILCPGFLDSKDYAGLVALANELAEYGYTVVRFDPTGVWESEGDIADYTTTQYLANIKSVLEYMLTQNEYTDILLGGHSRGGMVSLLYTARDKRISKVLGIMPSSDKSMTPEREKEWRENKVSVSTRDLPDEREKRREFRVPFSHVEDRAKYYVVDDVAKITVPIILLAGEQDTLITPNDVKRIFGNANEPKTFTIIPKVGHDYRLNDDEVKIVNEHILKALGLTT